MINELKEAIDLADDLNNKKAKEILLKIAMFKEENQKSAMDLVKLLISSKGEKA
jgi:hypothetical protein